MPWFYANAGKQTGPVSDADFERLAREGVIQSATLVWREGMANWQAYATVAPPPPTPSPLVTEPTTTPARQVVCAECGKLVPAEETAQFGPAAICPSCKPNYVQKLREGRAPPSPVRYAGFWIRVGAYMIDYLIMSIVQLPMTLWFTVRMQRALMGGFDWETYFSNLGIASAISTIFALAYSWVFVGRYAATPGKMLVKIKVVTADFGRVSYTRALGRSAAHIVSSIPCMLGYLFPVWDDQKRALHDYMCNTRVIYGKASRAEKQSLPPFS